MKKQLNQVNDFHKKFGHIVNKSPYLADRDTSLLRYKLAREELDEYFDECYENNIEGIADSLGDQLYILLGTILTHGLQDIIEDVFDEIHASNMSKLGKDGKPIKRDDGKVLKGPDYFKPNIGKFLKKNEEDSFWDNTQVRKEYYAWPNLKKDLSLINTQPVDKYVHSEIFEKYKIKVGDKIKVIDDRHKDRKGYIVNLEKIQEGPIVLYVASIKFLDQDGDSIFKTSVNQIKKLTKGLDA